MTLVELLVVVAILGLLAVTVLPVLSNTADARRTREATRIVTSFIAKGQSRAIGKTEWAGIWLAPPASNSSANFAIDLVMASVPAVFRGDTMASGTVYGTVSGSTFTITSGSLRGTVVTGSVGDLVRFDSQPPWYAYVSGTAVALRNGASYATKAVDDVGQSSLNTPWPAPSPAPHTFELLRQPLRAGSPLTLADGRCIDLRWSGHGGSDLTTYTANTFGTAPGAIAVLFDGTGRLRQIFANGNRIAIDGPVFLLIGRSDRAQNTTNRPASSSDDSLGFNWEYPDSFWVAIDPLSGVTKAAECTPGAANVFASQAFIRSEIVTGGR